MPNFSSNSTNDGGRQTVSSRADLTGLRNAVVTNYRFTGGVLLAGNQGISLRACEVTGAGVVIKGGVVDCDITACNIHDITDYTGVLAENSNPIGLTVQDNVFDRMNEGMHLMFILGDGVPSRLKVLRNEGHRIKHFFAEIQGDPNGAEVAYNWAGDWIPQPSQIAFSLATGGTTQKNSLCRGVYYHDNAAVGRGDGGRDMRSVNQDAFAAYEVMSQDARFENNFASGPWGCLVLYGWTSPAWVAKDNVLVGGTDPGHPFKAENRGTPGTFDNNRVLPEGAMPDPTPADVRAGRCPWQSGQSDGPIVIGPDVGNLVKFTAAVRGPGIVDLAFDPAQAGWSIWRKSTRGNDAPIRVADLSPGGTGAADDGTAAGADGKPSVLTPNWEWDWILRDAGGATLATATAHMPPDPPPTPTPTPTPTRSPTLARIVQVFSDGSVKVIEASAQ